MSARKKKTTADDWQRARNARRGDPLVRARLAPVTSLGDLHAKAKTDPRYLALAVAAAKNLGGRNVDDLDSAMRWLRLNQQEAGDEDGSGIIAEVNACREER